MGSRAKRAALAPKYCEYPGCDFKYGVQKHRIFPGREGGKYVLGNVIALCPNHHFLADRAILSAEELLRIVTERIAKDAIRQLIEGGTGSNTFDWSVFADQPATGNGIVRADIQDGQDFLIEGRCDFSALEWFRQSCGD